MAYHPRDREAIALSAGGTFTALVMGWGIGLITGALTRLFLSRPYRSLRSSAYEAPLEMRPFNEVVHVGERSLVVSAVVEEGAPLAGLTLAESGLRKNGAPPSFRSSETTTSW